MTQVALPSCGFPDSRVEWKLGGEEKVLNLFKN